MINPKVGDLVATIPFPHDVGVVLHIIKRPLGTFWLKCAWGDGAMAGIDSDNVEVISESR